MKNRLKKAFLLFFALLLTLSLVACKAGDSNGSAAKPSGENYSQGIDSSGAKSDGSQLPDKKIVRRAELRAETKDYDGAKNTVFALVTSLGGYTESTRESTPGNGRSRTLNATLRIPADRLDAFLSKTGESVHITDSNVTSDDITTKYYDAEARLTTLKAEKAALDKMLENAATTAEVLQIHERLYDVMEEIDSLTARLNVYKSEVAMSTVTLYLYEVVEYSPEVESFGTRLGNAFRDGWEGFVSFWQGFLVFLVRALPVLLTLAAMVGVVLLIIGLCEKRRKRRHAEQKAPTQAEQKAPTQNENPS